MEATYGIEHLEWYHGGIAPTQAVQFVDRAIKHGVTAVVESGRREGYSTLALRQPDILLVSIDINPSPEFDEHLRPLEIFGDFKLMVGDGSHEVPRVIAEGMEHKWAVLLDGPKGDKAINLAIRIGNLFGNVAMVAIHDVQNGTERQKRLNRAFPGRVTMSTPIDVSEWGIAFNAAASEKCGSENAETFATHAPLAFIDLH